MNQIKKEMRMFFKNALLLAALGTLTFGFTSCSDDDNNSETDATTTSEMKAIAENYISAVVEPTYADLASNTQTLYEACQNLYLKRKSGKLTQADIDAACDAFKAARKYWEQSEAFLYGAASDNDIDPHIDSWPLDHDQLVKALNDKSVIAGINGEQPDKFVYDKNGDFDSVLGFHGLEFVLFRAGANRALAALTAENETEKGLTSVKTIDECAFAAAVSGDLRNMTSLLAYGWMGEKAGSTISNIVNSAKWILDGTRYAGLSSKGVSYGSSVVGATSSTGMFATWQETMQNIFVGGCSNICQEVYTQKLGQAYRVATGQGEAEDAGDYIESPYSKRSFQDYQDNIYSIKNSLYGTRDITASSPSKNSLMNYLKEHKYEGYNDLTTAIDDAVAALEKAKNSGKAFIDAPGDAQVKTCIEKVQALDDALNAAGAWIVRQK